MYIRIRHKLLGFFCFLFCLWSFSAGAETSLLSINVGKADCHLLQVGEAAYLIDTGRATTWGAVSAVLRDKGINRLNGVFFTHTDDDHAGGAMALAASDLEVDAWYAPVYFTGVKEKKHPARLAAACRNSEVVWLRAGDVLPLENGEIRVLGPAVHNHEKDNNNSLVMLVETKDGRILLTGDMEFAEEADLLAADAFCQVDLLKVPDHGEDHACSEAFVKAVSPQAAVISTDSSQEKDTPSPRVLQVLKRNGVRTAVTQYSPVGVQCVLTEGELTISLAEALALPEVTRDVVISDLSVAQDIICIANQGEEEVSIAGWYLFSDRGEEVFVFPEDAVLPAGVSVSISSLSSEDTGDYLWPEKRVWHETKEDNAFLYDAYGRLIDQY